jgi:tryptophan synthase alpha chain
LKKHTDLPVAVGFGIRTPAQAAAVAKVADAAVVGTALVDRVASTLDANGKATPETIKAVLGDVSALSQGVRSARSEARGRA